MTNNAYGTDRCAECGDAFEVKSNRQVYCSAACRKRANQTAPEERQGTCQDCDSVIAVPAGTRGPLPKRCEDCKAEFERSRPSRRGRLKPRKSRKRKYQPGPVEGTELTLLRYDEEETDYGYFACSCGNEKRIRMRYVFAGYPGKQKHDRATTCGEKGKHRDKRMVEGPSIRGAHKRVSASRGSASEHPCTICGEVTEHNQWAYRHSSYAPLVQESGKDKGQIYSESRDDYWCLCRRHHRQWDSNAPGATLSGAHIALAMALDPYGDRKAV